MKNTIKNMSTLISAAADYGFGRANMKDDFIWAGSRYAWIGARYDKKEEVFDVTLATTNDEGTISLDDENYNYNGIINLNDDDSLEQMLDFLCYVGYRNYTPEDQTDAYELNEEYNYFMSYMEEVIERYCD